jgi:hypothetical protein
MPMAALPASLDGRRVLDLGPLDPANRQCFHALDAEEVVEESAPLSHNPGHPGGFDFIHCGALPVNGRQLVILSRLWWLAAPSATLLLGSRVIDDVEASRCLAVEATSAAGLEWIPGRLALRWMVESSGFDVLRWFAEETAIGDLSASFTYLAARRNNRMPVLLEQAGSPPEGDSSPAAQEGSANGSPNGHRDGTYVERVQG